MKDIQDILKKIKAEIDDLDRFYDNNEWSSNNDTMFLCEDVFEIIDKYITEVKK